MEAVEVDSSCAGYKFVEYIFMEKKERKMQEKREEKFTWVVNEN